jgi:hypothetical protein
MAKHSRGLYLGMCVAQKLVLDDRDASW